MRLYFDYLCTCVYAHILCTLLFVNNQAYSHLKLVLQLRTFN